MPATSTSGIGRKGDPKADVNASAGTFGFVEGDASSFANRIYWVFLRVEDSTAKNNSHSKITIFNGIQDVFFNEQRIDESCAVPWEI